MTLYDVTWIDENGQRQSAQPDTLREAKKLMKQHPGATGSKTKVYANGDWEPAGAITLKGSNRYSMVHNGRLTKKNY